METIRTLLVDDQVLFVESLKLVLETRSEDIRVVGIAHDGREAIEAAAREHPDMVLLDVRMPNLDGVEATRILHESYPRMQIIILTTFDDDSYASEALKFGAAGYVLKDIPPHELIASIRAVHNGSILISPQVANKLLRNRDGADAAATGDGDRPSSRDNSLLRFLSRREVDVLRLIGRGYDNTLIAEKLAIAEQTVKNHVSVIYQKLNIHDRARVMRLANRLKDYLNAPES
jgi:DNA-binding NarL/FixJ family response regulator